MTTALYIKVSDPASRTTKPVREAPRSPWWPLGKAEGRSESDFESDIPDTANP